MIIFIAFLFILGDNPGPGAYRAVSEFGCYEE